ncbi:MAG TPA: FecR domain-containing protein [Rhizomicrobium sp.]
MSAVTNVSLEIRAEAAAWLARLRADDKNSGDERAFRAWLAEDPRHAAAFEAVTEVWEVAGVAWTEPAASFPRPAGLTRRKALLAGVGSLAAAGISFAFWQSAYAGVYETAIGEQKHVVLPDGSQAFLDTDTRIHAAYDSQMRIVALERGRCNFHVMESDERPFVVDAAAQRIVAARTTFDVRRDGDEVCVVMLQGSASIGSRNAPARRHEVLKSGERLVAADGRARIDKPNLVPLLAWQTGQAVFDNDTVAWAIREMNRYSVVKIEVTDPVVARMRISGVYRVGDNAAFALSIAALLPVVVELDTDQVRLVVDQARINRT